MLELQVMGVMEHTLHIVTPPVTDDENLEDELESDNQSEAEQQVAKRNYSQEENRLIIELYNFFYCQRDQNGKEILDSNGKPLDLPKKYEVIYQHFCKNKQGFERPMNGIKQQIYKLRDKQKLHDENKLNDPSFENLPRLLHI